MPLPIPSRILSSGTVVYILLYPTFFPCKSNHTQDKNPYRPDMQPTMKVHVPFSTPPQNAIHPKEEKPSYVICSPKRCPVSQKFAIRRAHPILSAAVASDDCTLLFYRLSRSRLNRSPLRTLRTTPSLKNFSSPVAVRPPMYSLSAPRASRNPSLLLSLPLRRAVCVCGIGIGAPWWW